MNEWIEVPAWTFKSETFKLERGTHVLKGGWCEYDFLYKNRQTSAELSWLESVKQNEKFRLVEKKGFIVSFFKYLQ